MNREVKDVRFRASQTTGIARGSLDDQKQAIGLGSAPAPERQDWRSPKRFALSVRRQNARQRFGFRRSSGAFDARARFFLSN
jgi:hypothetical protein